MLEFKHLINHKNSETQKTWVTAGANEDGIVMQVIVNSRNLKYLNKGMNSMKFIKNQLVPKHKTVTYVSFLSGILPQKYKPRRMILTAGVDRL